MNFAIGIEDCDMDGNSPLDTARVQRMVVQTLEGLTRAGVTHMPKTRRPLKPAATADSSETASSPSRNKPTESIGAPSPAVANQASLPGAVAEPLAGPVPAAAAERIAALKVIQAEVAPCTKCSVLVANRTQTVFGVGNPMARLCFVGEAPGADEDIQGEPFVGRAGQLLTKIIEACQLKREDVYILNVLKCRPPDNRTPLPNEVSNCRPFLDRQLAVIRPEYICCLGGVAAQTLLNTDRTIGQLRGKFHDYRGIPVMCTYHPAYLLRNPSAKREVWEDMKKLMARLGVTL